MKVLLSAFSCGPGRGSDPGVGWHWVEQISRRHEVWLLTTDESQANILKAAIPNLHPTFIPSYARWQWLQDLAIPGPDWLYYYWWQWKAYQVGKRLHAAVGFDLVHHVTFVSWRAPSFLCRLPAPFIWGPVGGAGVPPLGLWSELGWKGRVFEGVRWISQYFSRCDPFVRMTMRRARLLLVVNQETLAIIPAAYRARTRTMLGIGMSARELEAPALPVERPGGFTVLLVAL
jgi:hypothetical protein